MWLAAAMAAAFAAGACSEGKPTAPGPAERKPLLTVAQSGPRTVDVTIAGPYALRGLQAKITYDPAALRVKKVEPGKAAERIDRVFSSDPASSSGSITFGLTDTRRVLLPARGALLRLTVEPADASVTTAKITVDEPLGALEGGKPVQLAATSAEVKFQ